MSAINVEQSIQRYQRYIQGCRERGCSIVAYYCPSCSYPVDVVRPERSWEPSHAVTGCPYCDALHYRAVWASGAVQVSYPLNAQVTRAEVKKC